MTTKIGVAEILAAARALNEDVAWHEGKIRRQRMRTHTLTKGLRRRLEKGETTGDRLQDLVLHIGGGVDDPLLPRLRDLEAALKGKKGEFVLVHFGHETSLDSPVGALRVLEHYRLGVLDGEELISIQDMGALAFMHPSVPVSRFIEGVPSALLDEDVPNLDLEVKRPNILSRQLGHRDQNPKSLIELLQFDERQNVLIIGDEAVKAWLKERAMLVLFKTAAVVLGKMAPEQSEEVYG